MPSLKKLARVTRQRYRSTLRRALGYPVVRGIMRDGCEGKRALLVYLVDPFVLREGDPQLSEHQNFRQSRQIAEALAEAGFCVDVADVRDPRFHPECSYDLVISHHVALRDPADLLKGALRVYLATGISHEVHNQRVRARDDALNRRRECKLAYPAPHTEEMPFVQSAHAVAGFGNEEVVETWAAGISGPVFPFNNYGFPSTSSSIDGKDFRDAQKRFLFFASRDQVAKGLDLLLDIFSRHPELHLYVCSAFRKEKGFVRCYARELFQTENIHPVGIIDINGPEFRSLTGACAFAVLPSCSEGQPGSIVQCMHAGLVPIVTQECGISLKHAGVTLPDDGIPGIENTILEVAARPERWVHEEAGAVRELALREYSEDAFIRRWSMIAGELKRMLKEGSRR